MNQVHECLRRLARGTNGPLTNKVLELLSGPGGWIALQQRDSLDPRLYHNSEDYFKDSILNDFARKSPPLEGDLHKTAVKAFWACERDNKVTNDRLDRFLNLQGPFTLDDTPMIDFIVLWREKCRRILGRLPSELIPRFSPGSTVGASGKHISIPHKIDSVPCLYPGSLPLSVFIDRTAWGRLHETAYTIVRSNSFFSVPKDAKKNRGCCKEASGAVTLQLALGREMRKRLLMVGIDLSKGQDLHRELARIGSKNDDLATIDLSNASDLICYKVVKLILPESWFQVLDSLRAPFTTVEGSVVRLEKFSSMGNGFTFELETLLFRSLIEAVAELTGTCTPAYVYGDDMIVSNDTNFIATLESAFAFFGFRVNLSKSYTTGKFRESCGGDYFEGTAVRPFFLTKYPTSPADWFVIHNGLVRIGRPDWTASARAYALEQIPKRLRLFGPAHLGDVVLWGCKTLWRDTPDCNGWDGSWIRVLQPQFKKLSLARFHWKVAFAALMYGVPGDGVIPRQDPIGYKVKKVYCRRVTLEG